MKTLKTTLAAQVFATGADVSAPLGIPSCGVLAGVGHANGEGSYIRADRRFPGKDWRRPGGPASTGTTWSAR